MQSSTPFQPCRIETRESCSAHAGHSSPFTSMNCRQTSKTRLCACCRVSRAAGKSRQAASNGFLVAVTGALPEAKAGARRQRYKRASCDAFFTEHDTAPKGRLAVPPWRFVCLRVCKRSSGESFCFHGWEDAGSRAMLLVRVCACAAIQQQLSCQHFCILPSSPAPPASPSTRAMQVSLCCQI